MKIMRTPSIPFAWLLGIALCLVPLTAHADPGVKYVPDDSILGVVFKPKQVWDSPLLRTLPIEIASLELKKTIGIAPEEVDSVLGFAGIPVFARREFDPPVGMVVKVNQVQPLDEILAGSREDGLLMLEEHPETGTRYLRSTRSDFFSVYPVDDSTLLFAPPTMLAKMLAQAKRQQPGKLGALVEASGSQVELEALLLVEPLREMARFLLSSPDVPEELRGYFELPNQLEHLSFQANLAPTDGGFTLTLTGTDEVAGEKLEQSARSLVDLGLQYSGQLLQIPDADQEQVEALRKYHDRISKIIGEALEPTREGHVVTISTVGKKDMPPQVLFAGATTFLLPMIASARLSAQRSSSMNNLKQIILGMHNYHDTFNKMPADSRDEEGKPLLSWRVHLLPFIDQQALYQKFKLDEPWDSEHNLPLSKILPVAYFTTTIPELSAEGKTRYVRPLGEGLPGSFGQAEQADAGDFGAGMEEMKADAPKPRNQQPAPKDKAQAKRELGFRDILDGTSNTLAIVEAPVHRAVIWSKPDDLEIDFDDIRGSLIDIRAEGFLGAMYDGSVHFFSKNIAQETLKALLTHAGGEVVGHQEWSR